MHEQPFDDLAADEAGGWYVGLQASKMVTSPLLHMMDHVDTKHRRPFEQWWMQLRPVMRAIANQPGS